LLVKTSLKSISAMFFFGRENPLIDSRQEFE
jgi:hypothetical protein